MKKKTTRTIILTVTYLALSIFYVFLFAPHGYIRLMDSYDILFHMNRISSLGNIFVSPVNFDYWGHVGNMTSIFYPWLTILPGYVIFQLAGNPALGYLIFLGLITFLTFSSAYFFMKKFSDNTLQSFLFSILYTLSFFRMASVFYRAGLAEFITYIFIPMLFYEFYQLLIGKFEKWPLFALSFTLIFLTHPLTAFTVVFLLLPLLLLVLFSKKSHSLKYWGMLLLSGVESIIFVAITTIGFTLPMYQQQKYVSVSRPTILNLADSAKTPLKLLQDSWSSELRSYALGYIFVIGVVLLLLFIWTDKLKYKIVGIEAAIAVLISTNLIPWHLLQNTFFNYMQFPWRFLNLAVFFMSIYISHALTRLVDDRSSLLKLFTLVVVLAGCVTQVYISGNRLNHQPTLVNPVSKVTQKASEHQVRMFTQVDYYPVRSLDHDLEFRQRYSFVDGKKTKLPYSYNAETFTVNYFNQKSQTIDLPILVYKGLSVSINNEPIGYSISQRGTALVKTNPGQNKIQLHYRYSTVAKAAIGLNIVGFIILGWLIFNHGKWLPKKIRKHELESDVKNS